MQVLKLIIKQPSLLQICWKWIKHWIPLISAVRCVFFIIIIIFRFKKNIFRQFNRYWWYKVYCWCIESESNANIHQSTTYEWFLFAFFLLLLNNKCRKSNWCQWYYVYCWSIESKHKISWHWFDRFILIYIAFLLLLFIYCPLFFQMLE